MVLELSTICFVLSLLGLILSIIYSKKIFIAIFGFGVFASVYFGAILVGCCQPGKFEKKIIPISGIFKTDKTVIVAYQDEGESKTILSDKIEFFTAPTNKIQIVKLIPFNSYGRVIHQQEAIGLVVK